MERNGKFTRGPVATSEYYSDATTILDAGGFAFADAETCAIMENYGERLNIGHWADCELSHRDVDREEQRANASLIASAFNAATACEDMGYDGEACVKALPELVESLTECIGPELSGESNEFCKGYETVAIRMTWDELRRARAILAKCRG